MSWSLIISLTLAVLFNRIIIFWGRNIHRGLANLITGFLLGGSIAMTFGSTMLASCGLNLVFGIAGGSIIVATAIAATLTIRRGGFYFHPFLVTLFIGICFNFAAFVLALFLPGVQC